MSDPNPAPGPLLELRRISKSFGTLQAVKNVHFEINPGEILGLVGENGAGKSTIIKLISGVHRPDSGEILWLGEPCSWTHPAQALARGIATIHQELAFFPLLTVAENLLLGQKWPRNRCGLVDWPELRAQAQRLLDRFGVPFDPALFLAQLRTAQKQELAIVRALARQARLLILDEPTASLSHQEASRLFTHLTQVRRSGGSVIYVSHRLEEVLKLCDRVAVLRDGEMVASYPTAGLSIEQLLRDMVGRPLTQVYPRRRAFPQPRPLLQVGGLTHHRFFRDISFDLHSGEVLGLAGLIGAGRSELARAIYGLYPVERGSMRLLDQPWTPRHPASALAAGLIYLPEERKRQGFVLHHSLLESVSLGFRDLVTRFGVIIAKTERARAVAALESCRVRFTGLDQAVGTLSGGNQQKVLLARWLSRQPRVFLLDEPTRGVDVGAKAEIHALIDDLAHAGAAILLISSDLEEVLGMSDRILVMHQGNLSAELAGSAINRDAVILAASGLYRPSPGSPDNSLSRHADLAPGRAGIHSGETPE